MPHPITPKASFLSNHFGTNPFDQKYGSELDTHIKNLKRKFIRNNDNSFTKLIDPKIKTSVFGKSDICDVTLSTHFTFCQSLTTCDICSSTLNCGWCESSKTCLPGTF
jgi:hypothetical protein